MKVQRAIDQLKLAEQGKDKKKKDKKPENEEKSEQMQKLEAELEALPAWPHFAELENVGQFETVKLAAAQLVLETAVRMRADLETAIRKKVFVFYFRNVLTIL